MWYNPFILLILRSPIHRFISGSVLELAVTGRKSGKTYRFPVSYVKDGVDYLVLSPRRRRRWANLRGGAEVTCRAAGKVERRWGVLIEGIEDAVDALAIYLKDSPDVRRFFEVGKNEDGTLVREDLVRAAEKRVMIRLHPLDRLELEP